MKRTFAAFVAIINDGWFVRRDAGKRAAWRRGSGPLL